MQFLEKFNLSSKLQQNKQEMGKNNKHSKTLFITEATERRIKQQKRFCKEWCSHPITQLSCPKLTKLIA